MAVMTAVAAADSPARRLTRPHMQKFGHYR
jgi:hypothetical protein